MQLWHRIISGCLCLVTLPQTMLPCSVFAHSACSGHVSCCQSSVLSEGDQKLSPCKTKCRCQLKESPTPPSSPPCPKHTCPYCQSAVILCDFSIVRFQDDDMANSFLIEVPSSQQQLLPALITVSGSSDSHLLATTPLVQLGRLLL